MKFPIGSTEKGALSVDILRLVDTRLLIQSNSGGGKSWLLRLIAERIAGRIQVIVLDPEGEFGTLRERLNLVLVGREGDVAPDVRSAGALARKLAELKVSAVIDLYDLRLADRRRFVKLFLDSLLALPRALWHPLIVMLDEAHLFCPERSAGEAECTESVIALMSQGRKRGYAGILSTQRLSKLHKDAAAEANNVIIGRTWLDVDQQRAGDLLGMNKPDRQTLRDLVPGEFYAFGPALSIGGVVRFRSDQVETTHPKAGARHELVAPAAPDSLKQIIDQFATLPQQAEQEARDLAGAQKRVAELERTLRARPAQPAAPPREMPPRVERVTEYVDRPVLNGQLPRLEGLIGGLRDVIQPLTATLQEVGAAIARVKAMPPLPAPRPLALAPRPAPRPALTRQPAPAAVSAENALTAPQQRIVDALAAFEDLGLAGATKNNAAVFAGQSPTSSGYTNNLGRLRTLGLLDYPAAGQVALTDAGRAQARPGREAIRSLDDLHQAWYRKLSRPQTAILQQLIAIYPESLPKADLAEQAGQSPTSSGYTNNLGALRSLGLIGYPRPGSVAATERLFPLGLGS